VLVQPRLCYRQAVALRSHFAQLRFDCDRLFNPLITGGWVDLLRKREAWKRSPKPCEMVDRLLSGEDNAGAFGRAAAELGGERVATQSFVIGGRP